MPKNNDVKESLKNTGIVGGSQVITIVIGIIRTKVVAVLLGPIGIGIVQLFTSTVTLVSSLSSLGLGFSGVREISEKIKESKEDAAKTIIILKRWALLSGVIGMFIMIFLSKYLSRLAFNDESNWINISILSVIILLNNIIAIYGAIIRGTRRMVDFAKINIYSAFYITIVAIPIYYFYNKEGIVIVLIISSVITLLINYHYFTKIKLPKVVVTSKKSFYGGIDMVQLGLFTVFTATMTNATLHYVRTSINDNLGIDSVGFYTVATMLAITYMSLIFNAMSADYFPKLSAINKDNIAINKAVLEQTKIVLLLGTPLIIGMYTFSEFLITILYTNEFLKALPLLMWMLLSVFLRLIGFPIGYVFLAKGKKKIFLFTQSVWNILFFTSTFFLWKYNIGLEVIGIAYLVSYLIGVLINIVIIYKLTKLRYDTQSIKYLVVFSLIVIIYFLVSYMFDGWVFFVGKIVGLLLLSFYCFKQIENLIDINIVQFIRVKLRINK